MDHPDLVVACVIGDGEAETGPLSASWRLPTFLNPRRDGAVLPILHLNGYKIAGPTVLGRTDDADVQAYLHSQGWDPVTPWSGDDPAVVFGQLYAAIGSAHDRIREIQAAARADGATSSAERHRWPAIVLRTPKGWTGPKVVDGIQVEGTNLAHQVPLAGLAENPDHLRMLEEWMRSYRPEDLFDADGRLAPGAARPRRRPADVGHALRQRWAAAGRAPRCPSTRHTRSTSPDRGTVWFERHPSPSVGCSGTRGCRRHPDPTAAAPSGCSPRTRRPATGCSRSSR